MGTRERNARTRKASAAARLLMAWARALRMPRHRTAAAVAPAPAGIPTGPGTVGAAPPAAAGPAAQARDSPP